MNCFISSPIPLIQTSQQPALCPIRHIPSRRATPRMTATSPSHAPAATPAKPLPAKRLCIFSDGTWNTPELERLTNIALMAQAVQYSGPSGVPQVVLYDQGVGTEGGKFDALLGGATGRGIDLNIQQLYRFLAMNYEEGDEVYLFGFSRGAYTVRSLAGLMHNSGLLYRDQLEWIKEAYDYYREDKVPEEFENAEAFKKAVGRTVPIKLICCFDTVGALGIPGSAPFPFNLLSKNKKYEFHDTTLSPEIENAIHVVSIDETMIPFEPTLMEANPEVGPKQLTQVYMAGRHGGIGGGEPLARNAALFVVEEMKRRGLKIDIDRVEAKVPDEYMTDVMPTALPPLYETWGMLGFLTGRRPRKIASFDQLHSSVIDMYRNLCDWNPKALKPFEKQLGPKKPECSK